MARPSIAIVDTGSGNLRSVEKALTLAGSRAFVTREAGEVASADKVVVPGQGAFGACMAGLLRDGGGLRDAVLEAIRAGKPYLGICMGLQLLFGSSEEEPGCAGLGVLPGKVVKFRIAPPLKVPHMGWNACQRPVGAAAASPVVSVLGDTPDGTYFYFVHSFYPVPERSQRRCPAVRARRNVLRGRGPRQYLCLAISPRKESARRTNAALPLRLSLRKKPCRYFQP
jgi:glutamine amidotransferase